MLPSIYSALNELAGWFYYENIRLMSIRSCEVIEEWRCLYPP